MKSMFKAGLWAVSIACLSSATNAFAADYPVRPISLVVPFAPGGTTDILARVVASELGSRLGQTVVVENKSGANGNIGTAQVARAAPDGYTLLMANAGTNVINPALYNNLTWDPIKSFSPVGMVARVDNLVVVNPQVKANTLPELVALAKASPGTINYGSVGPGSIFHLAGEIFSRDASVKLTHVPYKGSSPALVDTVAGHVQLMFATIPASLPFIKSGQLKALASTGEKRSSLFPDLPTAVELGYPELIIDNWFAILAPAGLAPEPQKRLTTVLSEIIQDPKFQKALRDQGAEPLELSGDKLVSLMKSDLDRWDKIVKEVGVQPQ